jgi:hypothetical protein
MTERSKRQSFLGDDSDAVLAATTVAVIGASGGGSHVGQQLAHVGIGTTHLFDPDFAEEHHRHRLIGISTAAVRRKWNKVDVVRRLMQRVHPEGTVIPHAQRWQDRCDVLQSCDLVVSCVDGYLAREELERYLRRFKVPLIDIGMDVTKVDGGFSIRGQVILSRPGHPCMRCFGFIRDELLAEEAQRYGDAGERAQVVWPNGALASTAVGLAVALRLPWRIQMPLTPYLTYDGNRMEIAPSPRLLHLQGVQCPHYVD